MPSFNSKFSGGGGRLVVTDLEVDSGTLSIDETNNRVGVGLTTPKTALTVEGPVTLKEQASADGDTAAYGQLWVKTATPNELYFTTDAGNDVQITSGTSLVGSGSAADDISTGDAAVTIATSSGNITLDAQAGDADIIFKGTDDASDITALTLDMSEAGAALFNAAVTVGTDLTVTGGDVSYGNGQDATLSVADTSSGTDGRDLTISAGSAPTGSANQNGGDLILKAGGGDGTGTSIMTFSTKITSVDAVAERMRVNTNGNVVINGSTAHAASLALDGATAAVALKEMSNAPADTAAFGQLWVKTATPNELYFTTDAGNDIQLTSGTSTAGGGGSVTANDASLILATRVFS